MLLRSIYFYYLKIYFPDQSFQKNILFNFEKGSTGRHTISDAETDRRAIIALLVLIPLHHYLYALVLDFA